MALDFNVEPYYDDYSENKKFYKILFRPGYAIQARELTQLQSILQKQVERMGDHLFKQGAMVIPGQITYDNRLKYVKLQSRYNNIETSSFINKLIGQKVRGLTSGVEALIVQSASSTSSAPNMIFVKYIRSGEVDIEGISQITFTEGEILQTIAESDFEEFTFQVQEENSVENPAFGESTGASIGRGVYYINGNFVLVEEQTIVLGKFTRLPTAKVGLKIEESIVEPEEDETLLDNAQNSYNYAAPGAHRYYINARLSRVAVNDVTGEDFIELLRLVKGEIQFIVNRTEYAIIADTMARRTFDESGNYTVRDFGIEVREYRNNFRGSWQAGVAYLIDDIINYNNVYYVARNSAVSSNSANVLLDSSVIWEKESSPSFNRGINVPSLTITEPALDVDGQPIFNFDTDGTILSQVFTTRSATVADNIAWDSKLSVGIESGKAYVQGYEIEKVATTYVDVEKSREFYAEEDQLLNVNFGNYVLVTNVNYVPIINSLPEVKIYNGYTTTPGAIAASAIEVGSARVRGFEYHSGSGASTIYKLFLFDMKMNFKPGSTTVRYAFNTSAKQFRIAGPSNASSFTADSAVEGEVMSGAITFTGANTTTIIGVNTRFLSEFEEGDFIFLDNAPRKITSIIDNLTMTISSAISAQQGTPVIKCSSLLTDSTNNSLIFELPKYAIKTVSEAYYYVAQSFNAASSASAVVTIVASGGSEFANTNNSSNYAIFSSLTGERVNPLSITRSPDNLTVDFQLSAGFASQNFIVLATLQKEKSVGLKTKTLSTHTVTLTTSAAVARDKIFLTKPDGVRIKSIMMADGFELGSTPSVEDYTKDITRIFNFNGGQTSSYYGVSFITRKAGFVAPVSPIMVTFEYFEHSSGDFFTADSYPNYKKIPSFNGVRLGDAIDFRPRVDDSSTGEIVFTGDNDLMPKFGQDMIVSYEYYLARNVKIGLNKHGDFKVSYGASSLFPKDPSDSLESMSLYELSIEPYTFSTKSSSVVVTKIDNHRYTMRDIGKLEKRIDNLEYYTTLSMLEQDTSSLLIQDEDGLNRFKNGFIVDNFKNQVVSDTTSPDYMCSVDPEQGVLRPFFNMNNVDFIETRSNNADRQNASNNYTLTGDIITLPYTEVNLIKQSLASTTLNVNPYAIFTFIGSAEITPPFDRWFEVNRRPDLITRVEGNFSAINQIAERAGVLGTVWNSWETQWTGVSRTSSIADRWIFNGLRITTTTTTTTNQTRTGLNTRVQETFDKRTIDDKVLSVVAIPFIRSRNILVQAKNLKPSTRFYPYFDKQGVSSYCKPASKIVITRPFLTSVDFDASTNVGDEYNNKARMINDNPDFAINIGDILFVQRRGTTVYTQNNSPSTAIVVGFGDKYVVSNVVRQEVFIVNEKTTSGTAFLQSDVVFGNISNAIGTVVSYTTYETGSALRTDALGQVQFLFNIPNDSSIRFRAGVKELALLDISSYDLIKATSSLTEDYEAQGYLQTRRATVQEIRNARIVTEAVRENRTLTNVSTSTRTVWQDPLAQTFLINSYPDGAPTGNVSSNVRSGGCFITKIDLFFATKDTTLPVTVQIREVVNGYPGQVILPFAEKSLIPSKVNVSSDASIATTFVFPSPVYVANDTEYCFVVLTNSTKYNVWVSELGQRDTITKAIIDKQPYAGVLFKSQNASTWTADQMQDMKFTIHRAKFKTGTIGRVEFVNSILPNQTLETDPLQFKQGSNKVRVHMRNHGLTVGSKVSLNTPMLSSTGTISVSDTTVTGISTQFLTDMRVGTAIYRPDGTLVGTVASIQSATSLTLSASSTTVSGITYTFKNPVNGISAVNIFKEHIVTVANELDSFIIQIATNAPATGFFGGDTIISSGNIMFDAIRPSINMQSFTNTRVIPYFSGVTGKSIDGNQVPYQITIGLLPMTLNETNFLPAPFVIANRNNTATRLLPNGSFGTPLNVSSKSTQQCSAMIRVDIYSDVDTLSPVIDARSVNAILISNKINNPSEAINAIDLDERTIISNVSAYQISDNAINISNVSNNRANVATLRSGQFVTVTGSTSGSFTARLINVAQDGSSLIFDTNVIGIVGNITIVARDRYFSEITPFGSSTYSKYVTKKIDLQNASTFLKIKYAASIPPSAEVKIFYKLGLTGSSEDFSLVEYTQAPVQHIKSDSGMFRDVDIDIPDLPSFNSIVLKICMTSTNSTKVPEIKDLRVIACA